MRINFNDEIYLLTENLTGMFGERKNLKKEYRLSVGAVYGDKLVELHSIGGSLF